MKKINVLMSTYNGEKYLEEQIESLLTQENVNISILVRDDGSTDGTLSILEKYKKKGCLSYIADGKNLGPAKSFMCLLKEANDDYDYYAFCDQDDVWDSKKLFSAISVLERFDSEQYNVCYSNLKVVDEKLNIMSITNKENYKNTLGSSFNCNVVTGCAMVLNRKLKQLISVELPTDIRMHDCYCCRVCMAIGGNVALDSNAYINYRQHSNNCVGVRKESFLKKISDKNVFDINEAEEIYRIYNALLTKDAKNVIEKILKFPKQNKLKSISYIFDKDFYTGRLKTDIKFALKILLK